MARSRSAGGESKQGLTISLVLFVLLSIVLGLMAYFGYAEQGEIEAKRKRLDEEVKVLKADVTKARLLYAVNSVINGNLNNKETKEQLETITGLRNTKDYGPIYRAELERHGKLVPWDADSEKPDKTYAQQVVELQTKLAAETANKQKIAADRDKERADFQNKVKELADARDALAKALDGMKDAMVERLKQIDEQYNKVIADFQKNIIADEKFQEEKAKIEKQRNDFEAKLQAAVKDAELRIKKLEEQIPDKVDYLAFDKPKGKVIRIDPSGTTCYIDLGSADLLRPGETFSLFGVGSYKANAKSKASLEVVRILGEHLAMARATEVANSVRDPILTGDELYNPAWSPGIPERIAIVGLIDLSGDGRDGTLELVRNLEKHGLVVDAYLDTKDMVVKGKGMNIQTRYLLLGFIPDFGQREVVKENDPRQDRILKINQECRKMLEEADKLGVKKVLARDFLSRMGYKLPRSQASKGDWHANMLKQTLEGAAPKDGKADPKDGKEMKKDEAKKDEK